ncbi:MAG: hypothetical protein LC721_13215, partial [Actinobacteria bacterium]|nr:hypothetical protein [Actinomycetota bacterium]
MALPVDQNITLAHIPLHFGIIDLRAERRIAQARRDQLRIKTPSIKSPVRILSGGNQQKVVVAKWLETRSQVLFFDEPARGIDVATKAEIFDLIGRLAAEGRGIVLISSYLPELLNVAVTGLQRRSVASPSAWRDRIRSAVSQLAAAGAVVVLFIYLSFASDAFLSANNLINIGIQSAVVAIIAIGMTIVIITAGIDLSVGSVAALSGVLGALLVVQYGVPVPFAIIGGAVTGAAAGVVNGVLVTQAGMAPFIVTLGMLSVARGLVYIVTGSVAVSGAPPEFKLLGQGRLGALPIPILALVIVALAGHFVLTRTKLGRYAYAMGSNIEAARLSGIPVKRYL